MNKLISRGNKEESTSIPRVRHPRPWGPDVNRIFGPLWRISNWFNIGAETWNPIASAFHLFCDLRGHEIPILRFQSLGTPSFTLDLILLASGERGKRSCTEQPARPLRFIPVHNPAISHLAQSHTHLLRSTMSFRTRDVSILMASILRSSGADRKKGRLSSHGFWRQEQPLLKFLNLVIREFLSASSVLHVLNVCTQVVSNPMHTCSSHRSNAPVNRVSSCCTTPLYDAREYIPPSDGWRPRCRPHWKCTPSVRSQEWSAWFLRQSHITQKSYRLLCVGLLTRPRHSLTL